jgi:hypothetical protein
MLRRLYTNKQTNKQTEATLFSMQVFGEGREKTQNICLYFPAKLLKSFKRFVKILYLDVHVQELIYMKWLSALVLKITYLKRNIN